MSRPAPTPDMLSLVRRLITHESAGRPTTHFLVNEKLRQPLCKLIGAPGYRSLIDRAIAAASHDAPLLAAAHTKPDGSVLVPTSNADPAAGADTEALLVAQLFSLLSAFIGHGVLLTVVANTWPDFPLSATESAKERAYDPSTES